jgi:hypothetical protein
MPGFGWPPRFALRPPRHAGTKCPMGEAARVAEEARRLARATAERLDRLAAAHEDLERRVAPLLRPRDDTIPAHDPEGREA